MKCRSVVGIWPQTLPSHRITAVAIIHDPPSLYTGAADGSIVWWHFSATSSSAEIKPTAMLCGHASPIVDLCVCYPQLTPLGDISHQSGDVTVSSSCKEEAALVSVCSEGVLCVWSIGSGQCRRRRKLPLWVGSPSMVQMLPTNRRYVSVASCDIDSLHVSDHDNVDSGEGSEVTGDQESLSQKATKCAIVILDSYTLTIVQTIFHGHLSVGSLKYMSFTESFEDNQKTSALIIDSYGKIQLIPIAHDLNIEKEDAAKLKDGSPLMANGVLKNGSCEEGLVVSVATFKLFIGLVYKTQCVILLLPSATVIGAVSFKNNDYSDTPDCLLSNVAGGMFISSVNSCAPRSVETHNTYDIGLVVWDDRGFGILYQIIFANSIFKYEVICKIPACTYPMNVKLSFNFAQLSNYIVRVESVCSHEEEAPLWRPYITIWSLLHRDCHENCGNICKLIGKNDLLVNGIDGSSFALKKEGMELTSDEGLTAIKNSVSLKDSIPGQEETAFLQKGDLNFTPVQRECVVSSTMVISQNGYHPYAIVYGYHSGDIEVIQFDILTQKRESDSVSQCSGVESLGSKQVLLGHTGAVLCLAAPQMVATAHDHAYRNVLLSGSLDCTVRVWDLETYNPIMVMHHHVAPVRQLILPPSQSYRPWDDCFLSVGEDSCVALVSLGTMRVERMFPGHSSYPAQVIWDGARGYLACLSQNHSAASSAKDALYIWDIKAGSRERVLRGTAAHSMLSNFCKGMGINNVSGCASNYNISTSSLQSPLIDDESSVASKLKTNKSMSSEDITSFSNRGRNVNPDPGNGEIVPIRCHCPHPGIASLSFDLSSLSSLGDKRPSNDLEGGVMLNSEAASDESFEQGKLQGIMLEHPYANTFKLCLLQFSLSFLHLWGVDCELDNLLMMEMNVRRYENFMLAPGLEGDRGSITLAFPAINSTLQLWKTSSEFCALRSLIMVSLAQTMVSLSNSFSGASSALAAFYTRNFAEKVHDVKPPSLQLLVSFWQDEDEHVRMAAKSLFHCAASRAIPTPLSCLRTTNQAVMIDSLDEVSRSNLEYASKNGSRTRSSLSDWTPENKGSQDGDLNIMNWLNSYELQDWISCVGGTSQDAMASHIIVAAALAIWYPSLVKSTLAMLVVHPLIKLVMAMNEKYSSAAAELLAEGMDCTWKVCLGAEIHHLIGDIFFQIECVSGPSANDSSVAAVVPPKLRETLISVLLPSLALGDIPGFLSVIEGLIWSTASDSPVHLVSLKTLIRLMRGSPRNLAQYLNKVVNFILQTVDPANSVMRRTCLQSSMATLREVVRVYPMVALNDTSTRLAVGDAIAEVNHPSIHVYDMQSVTKIKILDASGPPGLPSLLSGSPETVIPAISALNFSPDGEGLVAFSEHGLIIRWWSLGSAWWEKLSRNLTPVQCTKLIFVPPWEGFSPNSSRASIMANITGNHRQTSSQENIHPSNIDSLNLLLHNLDLTYRLEWAGDRKVRLMRHGNEIETFLL